MPNVVMWHLAYCRHCASRLRRLPPWSTFTCMSTITLNHQALATLSLNIQVGMVILLKLLYEQFKCNNFTCNKSSQRHSLTQLTQILSTYYAYISRFINTLRKSFQCLWYIFNNYLYLTLDKLLLTISDIPVRLYQHGRSYEGDPANIPQGKETI